MYNFILQTILLVSLGVIVYLIARAAPRVSETDVESTRKNYFDRLIKKLPLERADEIVSALFEKILRKSKVVILRLDNLLTQHLRGLRKEGDVNQPSIFDRLNNKPSDSNGIDENKEGGKNN